MKTILEQELTKEQIEWLKSHPDHDEMKKILIGTRVADWFGCEGKDKKIEVFRDVCKQFRKWWTHESELRKQHIER